MHFTEILLIAECFQELLWTLWTLRVVCRFALKVTVFFLGFRKLCFQTLLFTLLLLILYFELFHFLLEFTYLAHVLVSLLLEFRDLFFFISKLHLQAFVLVLGTLQIFLQLGHLTFKLLLFALGFLSHVLFFIVNLMCLHFLVVQLNLEINTL